MKKVLAVIVAVLVVGGIAWATVVGIDRVGSNVQNGGALAAQNTEETDEPQANIIRSSSLSDGDSETGASSSSGSDTESDSSSSGLTSVLDVSDLVEDALPEVVSITNTQVVTSMGYASLYDYLYGQGQTEEYESEASGSGIILAETDDEILIVTNNHVIENADTLTVTFVDDESVTANVKGTDSELDIAVIAVAIDDISDDTKSQIKVATYHDADDLKMGQGVMVIGNSLGYGQTVTVGYISALGREITSSEDNKTYTDLIQVDAAINPGNSGGALINMDGEVIGINVAKLASTEVEGVGYAIPIYKVMDVIESLSNARTRVAVSDDERGRLGVYLNTISSANSDALGIPGGAIIRGFSDEEMQGQAQAELQNSPAREAGLLENDIITKVDGQTIASAEDVVSIVASYRAGETITITYERLENGEYEEHTVDVVLGSQDDDLTSSESSESSESEAGSEGLADESEESSASSDTAEGSSLGSDSGSQEGTGGSSDSIDGSGSMSDDELYQIFRDFMNRYR